MYFISAVNSTVLTKPFYLYFDSLQGEPEKAENFLMDAMKSFHQEGWHHLADDMKLELAKCQKMLGNRLKYPLLINYQMSISMYSVFTRRRWFWIMVEWWTKWGDQMICLLVTDTSLKYFFSIIWNFLVSLTFLRTLKQRARLWVVRRYLKTWDKHSRWKLWALLRSAQVSELVQDCIVVSFLWRLNFPCLLQLEMAYWYGNLNNKMFSLVC